MSAPTAPTDVCPLCQGTGWKTVAPEPNRRVARCECQMQSRATALLTAARIPKRYEDCKLSSFEPKFSGAHASQQAALMQAQNFVREYPLENTGLLLIGPIGVGKTHLAVGVMKELLRKGISCVFYDYRELLKQIQNSWTASVQATEMDVLRPVFETEVLVLDDLGAVTRSEWVGDAVSLILNSRYNDNRTTILTTNYPDEKEAEPKGVLSDKEAAEASVRKDTLGDRIGERMRSRLHEMCRVVKLAGPDFRQKVRSANYR